jgi:hypothetical protein
VARDAVRKTGLRNWGTSRLSPIFIPLPPGRGELGGVWNMGVGIVNLAAQAGYVLSGNPEYLNHQMPAFRPMNGADANDANNVGMAVLFLAPELGELAEGERVTYLYEKVAADGQHLKYGITYNPLKRYTAEELAGGRLKILAKGSRKAMLQLERSLHSTLPLGPEEKQLYYVIQQVMKGLKAPPY